MGANICASCFSIVGEAAPHKNIIIGKSISAMPESVATTLPETWIYLLDVPTKPSTETLREQISFAAAAGFNGIMLPLFQDGYSLFPSRVAAEYRLHAIRPDLRKRDDLLTEIFQAAAKYDMSVFAYLDLLRVGDARVHDLGPVLSRRKKWGALNKRKAFSPIGSSPNDFFLCINNPEIRRFSADLAVELVESFPVDALILDLHHYPFESESPDTESCFCEYCVRTVRNDLQLDLPTLTLKKDDPASRRWMKWKEERFLKYLAAISGRLHEARFGLPFLPVLPGDLPQPAEGKPHPFSSISTWADEGIISSAALLYPSRPAFILEATIESDLSRFPDDNLLMPYFIMESLSHFAEYRAHLSRLPLWGCLVSLSYPLSKNDVERTPGAQLPKVRIDSITGILKSSAQIVEHLIFNSSHQPALKTFLQDLLVSLSKEEEPELELIQNRVEDLRSLEEKLQTGDMDAALTAPDFVRHLSLLKRLLKASIILMKAQTVHS